MTTSIEVIYQKRKKYRGAHVLGLGVFIAAWIARSIYRMVEVTRKTINTVEKGKYIPSTYLALKLSKALGVSVEEIFQLDNDSLE